jgi:hypothetical protein
MNRREFLPLLAGPALAQELKNPGRGRQVVMDALAAMGGDRFLGMKDRVEEGRAYSFYRERLSGLTQAKLSIRYLTRPEPPPVGFIGQRERQALGKKQDVYSVYADTGSFEITYRGARPLDEALVARWRESLLHNVFYTLRMRIGEPGLTFESAGTDIFENRPCEVVDIIDGENRITKVWFLQSAKYPVRQFWERRDPKTRERDEEVTVFDKHRDTGGGIVWPLTVRRERNGERIFEMYAESVKVNQGLTDELFSIPAGIPVLDSKSSNIKPGKK